MKKIFLTFVLAIVSSLWMMSEGACFPSVHTATLGGMRYYPGTLVKAALPCEPNMECPTCQALALEADNTLYYLTPYTPYAQSLLETIEQQWKENLRANVYGIRFSTGNAMYIEVYGIQVSEFGLFAICDEWNIIIEPFDSFSPYQTYKQHLTTDTVFRDNHWIKLQQGEKYLGALTEGLDASVFFTPANSTKFYTLYVFNAHVGEEYPNVWVGGSEDRYPEGGYKATVERINEDTIFLKLTCNNQDFERHMIWIKGVGMETGPIGWDGGIPGDPVDPTPALLCAYKQGQQVYASYLSEKYGCEYNAGPDGPHTSTTDTIPLYARDDSGSSTVDPVDPNQIYATLTGDVLTVHNRTGAQVTFTLNNTSVNNVAARARKNGQPTSFTESISVELTEDGLYEIWLTSEEWNYSVFGTINYVRSATTITKEEPALTTKKVLRDTQILIERGNKTYTLTGQEVK